MREGERWVDFGPRFAVYSLTKREESTGTLGRTNKKRSRTKSDRREIEIESKNWYLANDYNQPKNEPSVS